MKYTKEKLQEAATESRSVRQVCYKLGINAVSGSMQTHISNQLKRYEIDTSHFLGQGSNKGVSTWNRKSAEEILIERDQGTRERAIMLRRALLEIGREDRCEICHRTEWYGTQIRFEVHHKDKNFLNNNAHNLQLLCPNCHSLC